ncbi:MAG: choice-of-anchor tandem repeat GloVer-containing protein [Bryobacteraceae bacterium]
MISAHVRAAALLAVCLTSATTASAGQASYRIVLYMEKYDQPAGFAEGSPGVFYGVAGSYTHVGFSVTSQGGMTVLASFPSGHNIQSLFAAASNNRLYSTVQVSDNPASVFSVTAAAGSKQVYSPQQLGPTLAQSLPTGEFLATAAGLSGTVITYYLATVDTSGTATAINQFPPSGVVLGNPIYASDGNYYGIAGVTTASTGYAFRVTPSGTLTSLYNFPSGTFFGYRAPLLQAGDGNLYGAAPSGGANASGIIYKLTLDGQYTLLYTFPKNNNGGPTTLIEGSDGNLYGATIGNFNAGGVGQLFRITKTGQYTLLYALDNPTRDGACQCDMALGSDGIIYGTAQGAGSTGAGAVFALDVGMPKPRPSARKFGPESGPTGTRVRIWGYNLLSASVEFNGVPAVSVSSSGPNYVWATVPTGATTGPITVTTPGGSDVTQASFTVQ